MRSHLLTGAKLVMYVNKKPFGLVTNFSFSIDTSKRAIHVVDLMEAVELAPTMIRITGSMQILRQTGDGGAEGAGLVATQPELSRERYFSLTLVERGTDITVFQATQCSVTNQVWQVPARGFMQGTVNFEAIEWANETSLQQ